MKSRITDLGHLLVFARGEEAVSLLQDYCERQKIQAGWVSGIGALGHCELGFYDLPKKEYFFKTVDRAVEVMNLTGNVAVKDGKIFAHLHATVAGADYQAEGGHLKSGQVAGTLELLLMPFKEPLTRIADSDTGLHLLGL